MGKRANGEGSIFRDGKKWRAVLTVGTNPDTGKPIRKSKKCKSQADAREALADLRREFLEMQDSPPEPPQPPAPTTLRVFLADWLENTVKPNKAQSTHANYQTTLNKWVIPHLGDNAVADLRPAQIDAWLATIRRNGAGGRTVENAYVILKAALKHAVVTLELLAVNPCAKVKRPKHEREEPFPLNSAECKKILRAVEDDRLYAMHLMALSTGMRQGELFALEWESIDFESGKVRIDKQATTASGQLEIKKPKTRTGNRTIDVPKNVLDALHQRRKIQVAEGLAGSKLAFPAPRGGHLLKDTFRERFWKPLLAELEIDYRGYHHTRHTYATQQLAAGVPVHVVSRILGHSKPSITLDIYAHWIPDHQAEATRRVQEWLG